MHYFNSDNEDFQYASGEQVCDICGKLYFDHPKDKGSARAEGWYIRNCEGKLLKL